MLVEYGMVGSLLGGEGAVDLSFLFNAVSGVQADDIWGEYLFEPSISLDSQSFLVGFVPVEFILIWSF